MFAPTRNDDGAPHDEPRTRARLRRTIGAFCGRGHGHGRWHTRVHAAAWLAWVLRQCGAPMRPALASLAGAWARSGACAKGPKR